VTRTAHFRSAAILFAALFLLAGAERAFSYANCPHHGLPSQGADPAHAGHNEHSAPADHSGPCTCLGQCQTSGGVPVPAPGTVELAVATPSTQLGAVPAQGAPRLPLAPHTLPFATAPPTDR
jgi:hypothetical protein